MKQQRLSKSFSIKSLLAGFLALGLFVLSCEEDSNSGNKGSNSLALHYKATKNGSYGFYVKNFTKDGEVVFDEGVLPEQIKELLREYWKKSHVRWGIREKIKDKTETKIYWIQKNSAYKDPADTVQYRIEAPEERKDKFIPTDFPTVLLQKSIDDLEVVASVSNDGFKLLGTVDFPADSKTKLLQVTEVYGKVRNKTAIDAGRSGTNIIIPEATIYITHEDTGTIFHGHSDAQGNYHVSVRFGGNFSLSALKAGMQPFSDTFRIRLADGKKEIRDQNIDMLELSKGTTVQKNQLYDISGGKLTAFTGSSSGLSVSGKTVSSKDSSAVADATLLFYKKDTKKTYMLKSGADGTFSMNLPTNPGIGDNDETQLVFSASATGYTFEKGSIVLGKGGSVSSQLKIVELTPIASSNSGSGNNGNTGGKVKLSAPASVRSTDTSSSSITLEWAQVTNASSYEVYYSKNTGFAIDGSDVTKVTVSSGTSQRITGLQANSTYYFKVVAKGSGKYTDSDASAQKSESTDARGSGSVGNGKLTTPSSITLTPSSDSIAVTWAQVTNASSYEVYYSKNTGFAIGAASGVTKVTVSGGTSQNVTGLTANTSYYFRIVAKANNWTDSDASVEKSVKTKKTKLATPTVSTPSGNAITDTSVIVGWNRVTNASGYEVHYSKTSGFALGATGVTELTVNSGSTTSQSITGLTRNTSYYFKVVATGSGAYTNSDASAQKTVKTKKTKLATPTVSTPSAGDITATSVSLSWRAITNASGYEVYYSKTNGFAIGAASGVSKRTINSGGTTSQRFTGLSANTAYYFKVVATGSGAYSDSDASAQKAATTTKAKLATPGSLTTSNVGRTEVTVNWGAVANASGYTVTYFRYSTFGSSVDATVNGGGTTSHRFTGLIPGEQYFFKVMAKGGGSYLDSDGSSTVSAITREKLAAPTLNTPRSADITSSSISLSWSAVPNASGYEVFYFEDSILVLVPRSVTKTINSGATTSTQFTGLKANQLYQIRVRAKGSGSYLDSDQSNQVSVTTKR